jgi:hypothetical protein
VCFLFVIINTISIFRNKGNIKMNTISIEKIVELPYTGLQAKIIISMQQNGLKQKIKC